MTNEILTEEIDYSGCNEKIYFALREGRMAKCRVPGLTDPIWIVAYIKGVSPYMGIDKSSHDIAVPVDKPKLMVKKASEIMLLLEKTHAPNSRGNWTANGKRTFGFGMWVFCGKPVNEALDWNPEWIEEVK